MATYDYTKGAGPGMDAAKGKKHFALQRMFDMALVKAARAAASPVLTAITSTDIVKFFIIPAFTYVQCVIVEKLTVEGATMTMDFQDSGGSANFISAADLNTTTVATSLATSAASVAVGGGKYYTAANFLAGVVNNASPATFKILVTMICVDCRQDESISV